MKAKYFLYTILALAFSLRIFGISSNPPHLNWDEVSIGYNAYSVLQTGSDEWGKFMPIIFRAYGDYKLPVYLYASIPSIFIFGLNAFSIRLVSVLAGVATVFFTYLLTKNIFKKERIALIAAMLIAIEPWDLFLSRVALEANLALALIIAGVYAFTNKKYLLSSVLLGLSVWTYNSARIFVPLLILSFTLIYYKELIKNIKKLKYSLVILAIFILPMFWQLANSDGSARYESVKILDAGAVSHIIEQRHNSRFPDIITKAIYNRPVYFTKVFASNYVSHYSINYLFKDGGDHYQFNLPNSGLLFEFNFIFIILGITYICVDSRLRKKDTVRMLLVWFFLAPIASSLTREAPHALRNITFLPLPMILAATGYDFVLTSYRKYQKIYLVLFFSLLFLSSLRYLNNYFEDYKYNYSWSWQYGHQQVTDYISQNYDNYDQIIMTKKYGEPHEFLLFYGAAHTYGAKNNQSWAEPSIYQRDPNLNRFYQTNWYWVDGFDKFYFVNDWEIPKTNEQPFVLESGAEFKLSGKVLFVTSPGNYPIRFVELDTVYFLDGQPAFDIVTAEF